MLAAVLDHLHQSADTDPRAVRGFLFLAQTDLYRRMLEIGDFANAGRALREIARLTDL